MGAQLSKGGRGRGYRRNTFNDINVTPLVDVMLVLLIIFMVTAPMLTAGVTVDLPESSAGPVKGDDEPLSVSIDAKGTLYIQKTPVKFEELRTKIEAIAGENKEKRIFISGNKGIDYGVVMRVLGEINAAGFMKVALVTTGMKDGSPAARR